jgi:hypothetical protein
MVIGGIYLSGQTLADIPSWVGSTVVNVTVIAATLNAGAIYFYHANAPDVIEAIQAQELEDDLNEEALQQARMQVERSAQHLGAIMANRVTGRLKYRLRLPMSERERAEWNNEVIDAEAYDPASLPAPLQREPTFWEYLKSFFGGKRSPRPSAGTPSKSSTASPAETLPALTPEQERALQQMLAQQQAEQLAQTSDAWAAWDTINGRRYRWWCKICREEGKRWLWEPTCSHVQEAEEAIKIPKAQGWATMEQFAREMDPQPAPAQSVRQASETEPTYHPIPMKPDPDQPPQA